MYCYYVKSSGSTDWAVEAASFEIHDGILYFYNELGALTWVINDWVCFKRTEIKIRNADEFYERLEDE